VAKVAILNSINFDLIIISTIMLLWYVLDKMSWDCWLVLEIRERTKRMARRPRWMWFNLRMNGIFFWKFKVCLVCIFIFCFHFLFSFSENYFHFQKIRILKTCLVWLLIFCFQEIKTLKMHFQKEMYF